MKFRTAGTDLTHFPLPVFDAAGTEGGGDPNGNGNGGGASDGSFVFDAGKAYADLDADTRTWLQKVGVDKDPKALATKAYNQEKLLGSSITMPGKDAPAEEWDAFRAKLGRPETPDKYELKQPENMPEGMAYDGEFAKRAAATAHKLGLTNEQFAGLHDMFVAEQISGFTEASKSATEKAVERADAATEALVKLWGPIDGTQFKANAEIADKVFTQTKSGAEFYKALEEIGVVQTVTDEKGKAHKVILDARIAPFMAELGTALYTEDGVLRGSPDVVGNIFDDKSEAFNMTEQHKLVKSDPAKARSLIAAAGKKPQDFGLPANIGA